MTADKLIAMLQKGDKEEEEEEGQKEAAKEQEDAGGVDKERHSCEHVQEGSEAATSDVTADKDTSVDTSMKEAVEAEVAEEGGEWAALASVVSWNVSGRRPMRSCASVIVAQGDKEHVTAGEKEGEKEGAREGGEKEGDEGKEEVKATTPAEAPEEPLDPYDFNAGFISSIIDYGNLKWVAHKIHYTIKPSLGDGKAQAESLKSDFIEERGLRW